MAFVLVFFGRRGAEEARRPRRGSGAGDGGRGRDARGGGGRGDEDWADSERRRGPREGRGRGAGDAAPGRGGDEGYGGWEEPEGRDGDGMGMDVFLSLMAEKDLVPRVLSDREARAAFEQVPQAPPREAGG